MSQYNSLNSPRTGGVNISKLPADFIPRALARLLPSKEDITRLPKEDLLKLVETKNKLTALIKTDPVRFFIPNEGGQREFALCSDPKIRILAYLAGNKSGKSTAGAIKFCERLVGRPLWGRDFRSFEHRIPARGCVFAEDFDSHKEVTVPTILSWLPRGAVKRMIRNPAGQVTEMQLSNDSLAHFRTYDQGADKAEGKDYDIVWFDEPPPRSVFTAVFRGLVSTNGYMLVTATLLKETWLYDEMEHPYVKVFEGSIHDNSFLSEGAKNDFLSSLTEDERQVRESGKPASLTGLVYKEFRDGPPFVIEDHLLPEDCPIIMGVDPHERRPLYIEYAYVTPEDEIIWFQKALVSGSLTEIFDQLSTAEAGMPRPSLCIMDPNRGKARQIGGICWQDVFEDKGYPVVLGCDDLRIGHAYMRECLKGEKPRMRWFASLRGKGGPIWQMLRYSWEDWGYGRIERDPKEKPKDRHKDFPDIHRYTAAADISFDMLSKGYAVLDRMPAGYREARTGDLRAYY